MAKKREIKRNVKTLAAKKVRPAEEKRVKGGGKAQGGPIMAGWDVKANVRV
jgi:hypothetical protein